MGTRNTFPTGYIFIFYSKSQYRTPHGLFRVRGASFVWWGGLGADEDAFFDGELTESERESGEFL